MKNYKKNEILVREIIDIDTNYMEDDETNSEKSKKMMKKTQITTMSRTSDNTENADDEFNPTLQQWKMKLNPKFYKQFII